MEAVKIKFQNKDLERSWMTIAILVSLIFHILLILLLQFGDYLNIDLSSEEEIPKEVTVVFPENKPEQKQRWIVENMNENEEIPDRSNLLSDRNSRARNEELFEEKRNQPSSKGITKIPNLSKPFSEQKFTKSTSAPKFSRNALLGEKAKLSQNRKREQQQDLLASEGTDNMFEQRRFSAEDLGGISLSTYAWDYAPYINAFKRKLVKVWYPPVAFTRLGLISGETLIRFTINREGNIIEQQVLKHDGHLSLQQSSENAINAVFPFKPLPSNFPEETLTLTVLMTYQLLKPGSR